MDLSSLSIREIRDLITCAKSKKLRELLLLLEKDSRTSLQPLAKSIRRLLYQEGVERKRFLLMSRHERRLYKDGYKIIAGVDEVGRGALAGPIVAAAVILPPRFRVRKLADSKSLTSVQREKLYQEILSGALAFHVSMASNEEIDQEGLQKVNLKVLREATQGLSIKPDFVLSDGFSLTGLAFPFKRIIKGDSLSFSIAAASIIAKVFRDRLMEKYHQDYPQYCFDANKGYGTAKHLEALKKYGPCKLHRRSFRVRPCYTWQI